MEENIIFALFLTFFAGFATVIGSIFAFFSKNNNQKFLSFSLGFSAGVMIYVSMVEIFSKSREYLSLATDIYKGTIITVISFFAGMFFIGIIDILIPTPEVETGSETKGRQSKNRLKRTGIITALAIGIHNFPEGLATFTSALKDPHLGIAISTAIAIHNIPEGIATSIPIYYSTKSRKKAFIISFLSGMTEPLGALIGYILLRPIFNDTLFGIIFGFVAGIMVFISIEELLPLSREYENSNVSIIGVIMGMLTMAVSLILFM